MKAAHTLSQSVEILASRQVYRAFMGPSRWPPGWPQVYRPGKCLEMLRNINNLGEFVFS